MSPNDFQYQRLHRIFIVLTNACNARCKLCSYWKSTPGEIKHLSLSFIKDKVIPFIKRYEIKAVCITGGEPTLNPALPHILETINQTGSIVTMVTNGVHLDCLFDRIKDNVHAWLFSLDADNETLHRQIRGLDNFNELIAWPEKIRAAHATAQIAFNCLIQKQNVRNLVHLYKLINRLPCDGLFFNVPDLKPYCFNRNGRVVSAKVLKNYAILSDEEIKILKNNLAEIRELDSHKEQAKLLQSKAFFLGCTNYFEYLRGKGGKEINFKANTNPCMVPATSCVVDETGKFLPCFYLPPDFWNQPPTQQDELKNKYCRGCFQLRE